MSEDRFLTVHETDDSVIAVAEGRKSYRYFYHPDCEPDCIVAIITLSDTMPAKVQAPIVDALLKHGTSEQVYRDGYEAHRFLNRIRR